MIPGLPLTLQPVTCTRLTPSPHTSPIEGALLARLDLSAGATDLHALWQCIDQLNRHHNVCRSRRPRCSRALVSILRSHPHRLLSCSTSQMLFCLHRLPFFALPAIQRQFPRQWYQLCHPPIMSFPSRHSEVCDRLAVVLIRYPVFARFGRQTTDHCRRRRCYLPI